MKTTKEFNFEMFKNGVPVQTKHGIPVKFVTISRGKMIVKVYHRHSVIGNFEKCIAPVFEGKTEKYNMNGKKYIGADTVWDLEMVTPYVVMPKRDARGRFIKS